MKPTLLLTLSFLPLFALLTNLPLAFSNDVEQVLDTNRNPIFPGGKYYIMLAIFGPAGRGLKQGLTGNSKCPVAVLQAYSEIVCGLPMRFTIPGTSPGIIFTGTPLEIEFTEGTWCAKSPKWLVFVDNKIQKACVGIGGPQGHPGEQTVSGTFNIQKHGFGYKLRFCVTGSPTCLDIGWFDPNNGKGGRRLNLTEHEPFEVVFVDANSSNFDDGIIKSAVV